MTKLINLTNLSCHDGEFKVPPLHWTETVKKWVKKGRSGRSRRSRSRRSRSPRSSLLSSNLDSEFRTHLATSTGRFAT